MRRDGFTIVHNFKDGTHDPSVKLVPKELVARIHEIRLAAEEQARIRDAQRAAENHAE